MAARTEEPARGGESRRDVVTVPELGAPSYLQAVLAIAYRDEANSVPLTVATPAGMVFGNAVHPATWLLRLGRQLRELTNDDPYNESAQALAGMFEQMAGEPAAEASGIATRDIRWVYFTDALVVPTDNAVPSYQEPACWQIALRDVTGWTIGLPPT